jgi:hypothetical protein
MHHALDLSLFSRVYPPCPPYKTGKAGRLGEMELGREPLLQ